MGEREIGEEEDKKRGEEGAKREVEGERGGETMRKREGESGWRERGI
jgi:hypothetical protein